MEVRHVSKKRTTRTAGDAIRAARIEEGLTQAELAERMGDGWSQGDVSTYERGEREPGLAVLRRFAAALGREFRVGGVAIGDDVRLVRRDPRPSTLKAHPAGACRRDTPGAEAKER